MSRKSMEDIERETVPDIVGTYRPSIAQEREAYNGFRAHSPDELALKDAVIAAIGDPGVTVEVEGTRVTLTGTLHGTSEVARAVDRAKAVEGVGEVDDRLVVG